MAHPELYEAADDEEHTLEDIEAVTFGYWSEFDE